MRSARAREHLCAALTCLAVLALTWPLRADERPDRLPRGTIGEASACYSNLDYACVTDLLALMPVWYAPEIPGDVPEGVRSAEVPLLLEAGRILAVSHLALGQTLAAKRVLRWLLMLDPEFLPIGPEIPPRFIGVFHEVRAQEIAPHMGRGIVSTATGRAVGIGIVARVRQAALVVAELEAERNRPRPLDLDLGLRAGAGWVALTRQDAETFADAPSFAIGLDLVIDDTGWIISAEVSGSVHEVKVDDLIRSEEDTFRVLNLMASGGYELRFDWFGLRPSVGVGMGAFGLLAFFEQVGPALSARLNLDFHFPTRLLLSATGELRAVTVFDDGPLTSFLFVLGVGVGTRF